MARNDMRDCILSYELNMQAESESAEIMIYGSITSRKWDEKSPDMTAMDFDKLLKEAKDKGAKKLQLRINSPGGHVYQAVAMRTMLLGAEFEEIKVSIEGLCASAATLLCCIPGAHVSISEGSSFMIHNPSTFDWGTAETFEKTAARLRSMEKDFHGIYSRRSGKSEDEIKEMMDAETWMSAKEAVDTGFCDEMIEEAEAAACVSMEAMEYMRRAYKSAPEMHVVESHAETNASNAAAQVPAAFTEINEPEEDMNMETQSTNTAAAAQTPAPQTEIQDAVRAERERIRQINERTPAGYEEMAAQAIENGVSYADFCMQLLEKMQADAGGNAYLAARRQETQAAANVKGAAAEDGNMTEDDEITAYAKEIAAYAKGMRPGMGGMF